MKGLVRDRKVISIVIGSLFILIMSLLVQRQEAQAASSSITAGNMDTVSIFDMKSAGLKNLSVASSSKNVKVKKKTYTDNKIKHTVVLAWAPYSLGEDETATVTIKYYDIKKRKTVSIKKQVSFLADYNGGYKKSYTMAPNVSQNFTIRGGAKIKDAYSSLYRYESSWLAPFSGGGDGEEICTITFNKLKKAFAVRTNGYGMAECYVAVSFINGEQHVYRFHVIVPEEDGSIFTRDMKLVKDQSTVLYFTPPESGRLRVQTAEEGIVSAEITENKNTKEAVLVLKGLKEGSTEVSLIYDAEGESLVNKYRINVISQSPLAETIHLTPTEEKDGFHCIDQLRDSSGNLLKATVGTQYIEIVPDSPEVSVSSLDWDYFDLEFSQPGTYHIAVKLKNLEGKTVEDYVLTVVAGTLNYSDNEEIAFSSEAEAKTFFCGDSYQSWYSGEYSISFSKGDVISSIQGSNPWLFKSGDYAPGDAVYSFDTKQHKIIVKDYDRTIEIVYEIISKKHVRLTIEGRTRDFIRK